MGLSCLRLGESLSRGLGGRSAARQPRLEHGAEGLIFPLFLHM